MGTSAFINAFRMENVPRIELLLAAGARLSVLPEGVGGGWTRAFCDEHRRASRLRLALAVGARRGADAPLLHLTTTLLQSGAHEQPLLEWHDADDCEAYLPEDAVTYAHRVVRARTPISLLSEQSLCSCCKLLHRGLRPATTCGQHMLRRLCMLCYG